MDYRETLRYIHSLGNFGLPPSCHRIKTVLEKFGNPQNNLKAVHIAGTNGKGSVSAMTASIFKEYGLKTGLFISPYIIDFRERIQINGEYISENDLVDIARRVKETGVELTEFEFITAMAFLYFYEREVDILVCETGLGGRFDATNILENKVAAVITKIGLDHTDVLGDTFEKIAFEKCGILRDCVTVTSPYQNEAALGVIKSNAKHLIIPDLEQLTVCEDNTYIYKGEKYHLNLCGDFQIENSLIAIETVVASGYGIPYSIIYKGLEKTFFPARMELISKLPLIILDGAHNPDGAAALCQELKKYSGKVTAVIGMMRDKDCEEFLKQTLPLCKNAVAVSVKDMPRSLKTNELCQIASKYCECAPAADYSAAISLAQQLAQNEPIFIFGSLYLASGIRPFLKEIYK